MDRSLLCSLVVLALLSRSAAAAGPDTNHLFQLEKQNRSHPWLRVTADSGRFRLRAERLNASGLSGFEAHGEEPLPHDPLTWAEITRLDQVVTRSGALGVTGALVLGSLCAGLGNALGAPSDKGGPYAFLGLLGGGAVGAWAGSSYGDRFQKDVNWYTAPPPAPEPPDSPSTAVTLADSAREGSAGMVAPETVAAVSEPPASPEAVALAARIDPDDKLRVSGDFGRFQGHATIAGPRGLEGIVVDRHAPREWSPQELPRRITWAAIDEVQRPASNAGRGATIGALTLGLFGALLGGAAVAASQSSTVSPTAGAFGGVAIGGGIGLVIGAGVGSLSHHWAVVYRQP